LDHLAKNLEHYLVEVTGLEVTTDPFVSSDLPYFFARQYGLYRLAVGNVWFMAVFLRQEDEFKPAQFMKHMQQLPSDVVDEICVVAESLPAYVRKRLIEKGIAFVIPKVQMYLPTLGMELRSRSGRKKPGLVDRFSPVTQVVLIYWLLGLVKGAVTPQELSKQLWYSAMSMSRALDELVATQIVQIERVDRKRLATFPDSRKAIWRKVLPRLRNPAIQTVRISQQGIHRQDVLLAGITVLSSLSMLNEPTYPEYAVSRDVWKRMEKAGVEKIPVEEPGTCLLQVWCYDPKILEVDGMVDPFSLFLTLQDETDERIEMALEEMMERYL